MHNKLKLNMDSIKNNFLKNKRLFKSMEKITKFIFHFFLNYSLIMFFRILILKYTNIQSQMSKKIEKKNLLAEFILDCVIITKENPDKSAHEIIKEAKKKRLK